MIGALGLWPLAALAAAAGLAAAALSLAVLHVLVRATGGRSLATPVAAFVTPVSALLALTFGFVAADVWQTEHRARDAATAEALLFGRLTDAAAADALDLPDLRAGLAAYAAAVTGPEWGAGENLVPAPEAEAALRAMRRALLAAADGALRPPVAAKLIADFDELQDARAARLSIGARDLDGLRWSLLIFLAVMTLVTVAAIHIDRPPAGRLGILILTVAATAAIWFLALHAAPYAGHLRLAPPQALASYAAPAAP